MAHYITTYSGVHFYPLTPVAEDIRIEDIAHSLSLLCRANGHYKDFYSVADHAIDCAKEAIARSCSSYVALYCLLHDSAEAYISDIPRPVKIELTNVDTIEHKLEYMVYETLTGRIPTDDELKVIKEIDDTMLYFEFKNNMGEELTYCGEMKSDRTFRSGGPKAAEDEFLQIFRLLISDVST